MSKLERALAQRRADEAMALAELTLHVTSRARAFLGSVSKVFHVAFVHRQEYAKNGVFHLD